MIHQEINLNIMMMVMLISMVVAVMISESSIMFMQTQRII